jgi:hypothetical protein
VCHYDYTPAVQDQASIGVTSAMPDAGASTAVDSPSTQGTESTSSANVTTTPPIQEGATQQTSTEADPLAGVPSIEEVTGDSVSKEAFVSLRGAYDALKPQFGELTEKFKPFEPYADRFSSPEEVQQIVDLKENLYGWERDSESGNLVPATQSFAENLAKADPDRADFLAADLMNGMTRDPETGRTMPRIDLVLESLAQDPVRKAKALQILGGVEPTSIAPTWQPTAEELEVVKPELQDIYKKLPYDKRESLKLNDPDFINEYLNDQKFKQDLIQQNQQAQERETRQQQQREQYLQQQAQNAGNQYVETQFKAGFTEFAKSIVERSKFISPIDPQSPEAQQMEPQAVQQMNQEIQTINTGVGMMVSTVVAALSHPDTRFVAETFLKQIGIDDKVIQEFDNARVEFARNARDYGELNYQQNAGRQQNGNGQPAHAGLGAIQSNATRAMNAMKGRGNLVAQPLLALMSKFFEMKAGSYNQTLNGAPSVRPSVTGTAYDPTKAAPGGQSSTGTLTRAEFDRLYG